MLFSCVSEGLCLGGVDRGLERLHRTCVVQRILWLALELWARKVSASDEMSRGGMGPVIPICSQEAEFQALELENG